MSGSFPYPLISLMSGYGGGYGHASKATMLQYKSFPTDLNVGKDLRTENGSSQGHNLASTIMNIPRSRSTAEEVFFFSYEGFLMSEVPL